MKMANYPDQNLLKSKLKKSHINADKLFKDLKDSKKVAIICGPTCTGKSRAGIISAKLMNTDIISIDSMQVYRGMNIGTDKYNSEDYGVKQYMTDIFEPDHNLSVVEFKDICRNIIEKEFFKKKKIPLMVGGSGMYMRGVIKNMDTVPRGSDKVRRKIKENIEREGTSKYYKKLREIDKDYADKISENDYRRIVRALEVYEITGMPFSSFQNIWNNNTPDYNIVLIGFKMEKSDLNECIKKRVGKMFENGLIDEVSGLVRKGYKNCNSMQQAVGYKEVLRYLDGEVSLKQCMEDVERNTRKLAKKQMTWFRSEQKINWLRVSNYDNIFNLILDIFKLLEKSVIN